MTMTEEIQRLPEEGEIMIAAVREVTGHGAYATVDEYNNMAGFLHIAEIATSWIRNIELCKEIKIAIEEASKRIPIALVEISGMMGITLKKPEGIEIIKIIIANAEGNRGSASVIIPYIGAPRYRTMVKAENLKIAEKLMKISVEKIRVNIEKQHGTFNYTRQDSRKSHTLQQAQNDI